MRLRQSECSLVPRPIPSFSMFHTEKQEGLVHEVTCSMSWWLIVTWSEKSRSIEVNKTRPFLCICAFYQLTIEGSPFTSMTVISQCLLSFASYSAHKPGVFWPTRCSGFSTHQSPVSMKHWKAGNGPGDEANWNVQHSYVSAYTLSSVSGWRFNSLSKNVRSKGSWGCPDSTLMGYIHVHINAAYFRVRGRDYLFNKYEIP